MAIHPTPSAREKRVGYAVLLGLVLIAAGILAEQRRFNPALNPLTLDEAAPDSASLAAPTGWTAMGAAETFSAENLSDKIDGRAELYLEAGFKQLVAQRMSRTGQPDVWLEALLYTMNSRDAAYAVFSGQRRAGAHPLAVGDEGYAADNAAFAIRGALYAEVVAAQPGLDTDIEVTLRGLLGGETTAPTAGRSEKEALPAADQMPGTLSLIMDNAFGFDQFDRLYVASYSNATGSGALFVSKRATATDAATLASGYRAFVEENGGESRGEKALELFGRFEAVASEGEWLFGAHDATSEAWAASALEALRAQITGEKP